MDAQDPIVGYQKDIQPLFTPIDIEHMSDQGVKLDDYVYISDPSNAKDVYNQLVNKWMPPPPTEGGEGPWPDSKIALFKSWMDGGYQP